MDYSKYSTIVFLDANVILEGGKIGDQPWHEIDDSGGILLLFVPQVLKEIDSKKRDGRLAKHARDFNRLIAPAAETGGPVRLVDGPPLVDLSLAVTNRVDWDKLHDLDPEEPDARVVAQVLNEKHTNFDARLFVSQDINPIGMATRHGLKVKRLPESWLRAAEPSPDQRKISKLEEQVRVLKATEPDLEVLVNFSSGEPFVHVAVPDLTPEQKQELQQVIIDENPRVSEGQRGMLTAALNYDHEYNGKYKRWQNKTVPNFAKSLSNDINLMWAQTPISFELRNNGAVQAEDLVLNVKVVNGTISDRWNIVPVYPPAPRPDPNRLFSGMHNYTSLSDVRTLNIGRHEMCFYNDADGGDSFEVHCQDFRHGRSWVFDAILTAEPTTSDDVVLIIDITASNMRGSTQKVFKLSHAVCSKELSSIYDIRGLGFVADLPMKEELKQFDEDHDFSRFNFLNYDKED
ncbi:PIN domain-containing protein [Phaeobacter sp. HF9A]|uniref:PIN domain-containing protein n=1 Tax=Phaeobacter sp. HF9A TaxID=2721561 RepID=UPI0014308B39|nr:PIN domain-containing protein [Phaeobacter sp. HF9A]NIZ13057.1 hypothetical protein [Phaeobacter sp. HF9A]